MVIVLSILVIEIGIHIIYKFDASTALETRFSTWLIIYRADVTYRGDVN